jgi:hypothetical protein
MDGFQPNAGLRSGDADRTFIQHDQAQEREAQDTQEINPVKQAGG